MAKIKSESRVLEYSKDFKAMLNGEGKSCIVHGIFIKQDRNHF